MLSLFLHFLGLSTAAAAIITGSTSQKDFEKVALEEHNKFRQIHQISEPMTLDSGMSEKAQKCADYYASIGTIDHSCKFSEGYGENLFFMSGGRTGMNEIVRQAVQIWYSEGKLYNYNKPGFSYKTGHFTQLIWKSTKMVSIGVAKNSNSYFVTALYYPPGNVENEYSENVLRPNRYRKY